MPYRDDVDALQAKKELLEEDLARITAQKRALESIARDEKQVTAELDKVRRRLEERRKKLPLLSNVSIASPCNADWSKMAGDERVRFCGSCEKNVYNISSMTAEEADRLIAEKEGELCVRYYQRADGTILTADCAVGVRKKRVRRTVAGVAVGAGLMTAGGGMWWADEVRMGGIEAPMGVAVMGDLKAPEGEQGSTVMGQMADAEWGPVDPKPQTSPPPNPPPAPKEAIKAPAPKKAAPSAGER
ncbi:hypothetical protein [Polyangium aurulentum]|uniref:hypothetical protein n=1 Tax=Polyangium aurulentum TaxID=2567896 RepID=UPI0010AE7DA3|nr:hypothetical protein [Polyangium aurulentum]UQA60969.1 hypothetical protein E8A73_011025 [Polyangium aurulentum]